MNLQHRLVLRRRWKGKKNQQQQNKKTKAKACHVFLETSLQTSFSRAKTVEGVLASVNSTVGRAESWGYSSAKGSLVQPEVTKHFICMRATLPPGTDEATFSIRGCRIWSAINSHPRGSHIWSSSHRLVLLVFGKSIPVLFRCECSESSAYRLSIQATFPSSF